MVVLDSSSLILLAKTGLLDLASTWIKEKLVIPLGVYEESVKRKQTFDALLIEERVKHQKIYVQQISDEIFLYKLTRDFNIGKGEAEAIALSLTTKAIVVTDDKKALNCCRVLGIEFVTVPNILVELYQRKIIGREEAKAFQQKLQLYGRYSAKIMEKMNEDLS